MGGVSDKPDARRLVVVPPPATGERDDDTLMLAARAGERDAFDALVRRHQRRVVGYAQKFFNHPALAHDIAQDVFVDVLRALPHYRPEGHFTAFLYRVTLNRCRMAARARRYEESLQRAVSVPAEDTPDRERERAVQAAMMQLTEKQREVLLLRFFAELSLQEIGRALGIRLGTVKSRLFGAVAALRKVMAGA
jgi:RNA polymerase sigma-70 factor (ECF subfamily)